MGTNGRVPDATADGGTLRWSGRVLAEEDLRRSLNGHRRLLLSPRTIVTPLAAEELKARGIEVGRDGEQPARGPQTWGYAQDHPHPFVQSAVRSLERDGLSLWELPAAGDALPCRWARSLAECVARGECAGGVLFCSDPGLVCCVANKLSGLRAVAVSTVQGAARAALALAPNLVAVEMPGRTFYELRQIVRLLCSGGRACPPGVACTLGELDGHPHGEVGRAHR